MLTTQADKAQAFKQMHERSRPLVMPDPWDTGTARILAALGFEALATTSAGMAFSMGRRDGAVKREAALAHYRMLADATPLPVSGDLENGFGDDPATVAETIRLAADAGLVGGSIEDATGNPAGPIYCLEHAVARIEAAVAAARTLPFPFVVTARAENFLYGNTDLDDTIQRLQAYEKAGADVLYAPGLTKIDDIRRVCQAVKKPVNVLGGIKGMGLSVDALAAAGVRRISLGSMLARAALGAFLAAAREIKEQGTFALCEAAVPTKELNPFFTGKESA